MEVGLSKHICRCGRGISSLGRGRPRKFCTTCQPRKVTRDRRPDLVEDHPCLGCGIVITGRKSRVCSERCKWKIRPRRPCVKCGEPSGWSANDNRGHGLCRRCRGTKPKPKPLTWACLNCGIVRTRPPTRGQVPKYCSRSCEQTMAWHRRRARMIGAFVEDVNRLEVFLADGYKCYLCGKKTDPSKVYPHPKCPTIDHIVPLSKGGLHERSNCRTACAKCNWSKQDRGGGEQFAIVI